MVPCTGLCAVCPRSVDSRINQLWGSCRRSIGESIRVHLDCQFGLAGGLLVGGYRCSGAIAARIQQSSDAFKPANDETIASIALYQQWQDNVVGLLRAASHGQRLLRLNRDEDLVYCADYDRLTAGAPPDRALECYRYR